MFVIIVIPIVSAGISLCDTACAIYLINHFFLFQGKEDRAWSLLFRNYWCGIWFSDGSLVDARRRKVGSGDGSEMNV